MFIKKCACKECIHYVVCGYTEDMQELTENLNRCLSNCCYVSNCFTM